MSASEGDAGEQKPPAHIIVTTHWSVVLAAGDSASPQHTQALETLCRTYWYPTYAFIRRRGHDEETAKDLTQEFFCRLLAKRFLDSVDPAKGRFRTFLLTSVQYFLANEWDRRNAQKRGGRHVHLPLDDPEMEGRYQQELAHDRTPEQLFDRAWALELLAEVLARLREECRAQGKERLFDALKAFLSGDRTAAAHAEIAGELGLSEEAVRVAVVRLRRRYQEMLREHIASTVPNTSAIDEELRHLISALRD